jgi:hypothetical protein
MDKKTVKKNEKKVAKVIIAKMKKPMPKTKKCPACESTKQLDSFGTRKTKHVRDGTIVIVNRPQSYCLDCRQKHRVKMNKLGDHPDLRRKKAVKVKAAKPAKPAPKAAPKKNHAPKPSLKELISGKGDAVAAATAAYAAEKKADADF